MSMNEHGEASHLWYTRRDGEVRGPFPAALVSRYILLGRIHAGDELSTDRVTWLRYEQIPQLIPEVMRNVVTDEDRQRVELARMREDERSLDQRRQADDAPQDDRRQTERRAPELQSMLHHRASHARLLADSQYQERSSYVVPVVLTAVVLAAFAGLYMWQKSMPRDKSAPDCQAAAAPGVNWSYCHLEGAGLAHAELSGANLNNSFLVGANLQGARLGGSDLSYANLATANLEKADLRGARLKGAVLRKTRLSGARLEGADLGFANLSGADITQVDFSGVHLGKATWIDGRLCAAGSVGECR